MDVYRYQLRVDNNTNFSSLLLNTPIYSSTYTTSLLLANTTCSWQM